MQQLAKNLRSNQTDAERLLWRRLRNRVLIGEKFRRQHVIGPYIVDFVCIAKKLIVELDGGQHAEQQAYDRTRTLFLESRGFRVARFWNTDVLANMEGVLQVISELLRSPPHPSPLPHYVVEREQVSAHPLSPHLPHCAVEREQLSAHLLSPPLPHIVGERAGVRGS